MSHRESLTLNHTLARLRIQLRNASTFAERTSIQTQIATIAARLAGGNSTAIAL